MSVVPGSSANAVRFTPGLAKTNVPAGASTCSPSSSNRRPALLDEVELLVGVLLGLVVLVDQPVARLAPGERVDAERHDAEVLPDRPPRTASVADLVDLVELCHRVAAHPRMLTATSGP